MDSDSTDSGTPLGSSTETCRAWRAMLHALPIPAALVDESGQVRAANRWLDTEPGTPLLRPSGEDVSPGLRFGQDGESRWRVRPLNDKASIMLATAEREDAGDHLLRKFFGSADWLFVVYDQWGRVVESNPAWEALLGYSSDEVFGFDSWELMAEDDGAEIRANVEYELVQYGRSKPTFRMRTADGSRRLVQWNLHFDASVGRCFGLGRDVTEERRMTDELHRLAYTDALTGLATRVSLLEELEHWLSGPTTPALLFCDLDHFKVVNDSLGHQAGDDLLASLGRRLAGLAGLADRPDSMVARIGGDEFVALMGDADHERATAAAAEILDAMAEPFHVAGRPIHVNMSIGIAVADQATTADALLGEADTAAYKAKQLGRSRHVVFDEDLRATVDRRFNVEEGLRRAIDDNRIEVHYQPIVALPGGGVVGMEALVRWRTDDGRLLLPGEFLDVAEDAGLMPRISRLVMRQALEAGARFADLGRPLLTSINISGTDLATADGSAWIPEMIEEVDIDPALVMLEMTESAVLRTDTAVPLLRELRSAKVMVGLDDFGTGFSSLAHLRELPMDVVKVDRSFVVGMVDDPVTRAVTGSLVELCNALGLQVVLEGIETRDQALAADQLGATMAQGFLFHRPMPQADLEVTLGLGDRGQGRSAGRQRLPGRGQNRVSPVPVSGLE